MPKALHNSLLLPKLQMMDCSVHFISQTGPVVDQHGQVVSEIDYSGIQKAWQTIQTPSIDNRKKARRAWKEIDAIAAPVWICQGSVHSMIRCRLDTIHPIYCVLVDDEGNAPLYELLTFTNQYQVSKGYLPIHACGVIQNDSLFLFGGPSGAGKSTIANLSDQKGARVLDEDQLLLRVGDLSHFTAQSWGYSLKKSDAHLKAIFRINKADEDLLVPLTPLQTSQFLVERYMEVTGNLKQFEIIRSVFQLASRIARLIPGYELFFKKSVNFWDLIEDEIPFL